jgi:hypothetical protein
MLVRFTRPAALASGDLVVSGQSVLLEADEARRHLAAQRAVRDAIKVRLTQDHVLIGNEVCAAGTIREVPEAIAIRLYKYMAAELVDPGSISITRLPVREPPPKPISRASPLDGQPLVRVKATRLCVVPGGSVEPGQEILVPEEWACIVATQPSPAITILGLEGLSIRATQFLKALQRGYSPHNRPEYKPWALLLPPDQRGE